MMSFGPADTRPRVTIGLDLGHANDYSAIAVLEHREPHEQRVLRHAARFPLGTSFSAIVTRLARAVASPDCAGRATIVADATGLGAPVIEMLRGAGIGAALVPVVITGGNAATRSGSNWNVPKKELITALYLMFETRSVRIPASLPGYRDLADELLNYQITLGDTARPSFGPGREEFHDDLVMALALAAWHSRPRGTIGVRGDGRLV